MKRFDNINKFTPNHQNTYTTAVERRINNQNILTEVNKYTNKRERIFCLKVIDHKQIGGRHPTNLIGWLLVAKAAIQVFVY